MGSDESHFNVSLTVSDSHKTASTDHNFWRERKAEADSNRGPSAYHMRISHNIASSFHCHMYQLEFKMLLPSAKKIEKKTPACITSHKGNTGSQTLDYSLLVINSHALMTEGMRHNQTTSQGGASLSSYHSVSSKGCDHCPQRQCSKIWSQSPGQGWTTNWQRLLKDRRQSSGVCVSERERERERERENTLLHKDKDLSTSRLFYKSVTDDKHSKWERERERERERESVRAPAHIRAWLTRNQHLHRLPIMSNNYAYAPSSYNHSHAHILLWYM